MNKILKRSEVDINQTWDLTSIFSDNSAWEKEYKQFELDLENFSKLEDAMLENVSNFKNTFDEYFLLSNRINKLYVYMHLKGDEDTSNSLYQEYNSKVLSLYSKYSSKTTFVQVKALSLEKEKLEKFLEDDSMKTYRFYFEKLLKSKEHILSQKEEELMATLSQLTSVPSNAFSMLNNADISFQDITDSDGKVYPLNHSRYAQYLDSEDRILRKNAYESMYKSYKGLKNTFATTLSGVVLNHTVFAKIRKYESARSAALSNNFIDEKVYDALVEAVNDKLDILHKYVSFRKKKLNLDDIYMYDMYVPLIDEVDLTFTYEEAKEIILDALKVLGDEYVSLLKEAFEKRWIDYAENEGKRSGAYSSGTYGTNPYILISYRGTVDNLFTLAHELGHSIHSYYTRNNQPYVYGNYTIFLAEIASITNEIILNEYLLEKYKDNKKIKAYLINHYLDKVKGSIYRQTQFAQFENEIHKMVENGEALSSNVLSKLYADINAKYYGKEVTYDDNIAVEWARIPHFYYNFYVYQYATGMSAAYYFANKILKEGKEQVDKYIEFLKSGSSDYSLNILKKAGIDMSNNKPVYMCLESFKEKLDELEKLI